MLTKLADEQNTAVTQNDISSSKEAHKATNETTSRDEITIKSSPQVVVIKRMKEAIKSPAAPDPVVIKPSKPVTQVVTVRAARADTSNEPPTPASSKKKL